MRLEYVSFSLTIVNGFIMLAYALSSTTAAYNEECAKLRSIFFQLDYTIGLINSTINMFIQNIVTKLGKKTYDGNMITTTLAPPRFKGLSSARSYQWVRNFFLNCFE